MYTPAGTQPQYEVKLSNASISSEYYITPLPQVTGYTFSANAQNIGTDPLTNVTLIIDINTGLFTDSGSTPSLAPSSTVTLSMLSPFTPIDTGLYNVDYSLTVTESESNLNNNSATNVFEISDTVYARKMVLIRVHLDLHQAAQGF